MGSDEALSAKELTRIAIDHQGRIGGLEAKVGGLEHGVNEASEKIDRLYALGWRLFLGVIGAIAAPFVANAVQHLWHL